MLLSEQNRSTSTPTCCLHLTSRRRRIAALEEQASQLDQQQPQPQPQPPSPQQQRSNATTNFILRGQRKKGEVTGMVKEEDVVSLAGIAGGGVGAIGVVGGGSGAGGGAMQRPKSRGGRLENTGFVGAGLARDAQTHGFEGRFALNLFTARNMTVKSISAVVTGSALLPSAAGPASSKPSASSSSAGDVLSPRNEGAAAPILSTPLRMPTLATLSPTTQSSISLPASSSLSEAAVSTSSTSKAGSRLDAAADADSDDDADAAAATVLPPSHPQKQHSDVRQREYIDCDNGG